MRLGRKFAGVLISGMLLLVLAACSQAEGTLAPLQNTPTQLSPDLLSMGFADSLAPLMEAVIPVYEDEHPAVYMETQVANSAAIQLELTSGDLGAVLVAGEPVDFEGWSSPVALEGLALVVNPENQVTGLAVSQAQAIFQGKSWSWSDVGGAGAEIEVVTREDGSAMRQLFQLMVMKELRVTLTAVVMPDTQSVLDYVSSRPWAIAYVAAAAVDDRVKLLAVDGLYPTVETLAGQSYPLTFPVYFLAMDEPTGALREFPAWLLSRDGQAVIGRHYGRVR